eukprot:jgi/Mesen1/10397/ME000081S09780
MALVIRGLSLSTLSKVVLPSSTLASTEKNSKSLGAPIKRLKEATASKKHIFAALPTTHAINLLAKKGKKLPSRLFCWRAMATDGNEAPSNNPGLAENLDDATQTYIMQQTMYRIRDPKLSLDFYSRILGMRLLKRLDYPEAKFSLYFMGYEDPSSVPQDDVERMTWLTSRRATIELTHNWGTESDPDFKGYHSGNSDPRGFGHIGITVDDVETACARFEKLGVEFVKKPQDGTMKGLAFIKDPDGYYIEIFDAKVFPKFLKV